MGNTTMGEELDIEESKEQLKQLIQKKFGSMLRFAHIVGLDYWTIQNTIRPGLVKNPQKIDTLLILCQNTEDRSMDNELTKEQRLKIRQAIIAHPMAKKDVGELSTIASFCKNAGYDKSHMDKIINETPRSIKRITPLVLKLCKLLKITI